MNGHETWVEDTREALERRIVATEATPDFLDVVTRAHGMDPRAIPVEALDEADALASAVDLEKAVAEEDALDEWLGDVRAAVERRVEERRGGSVPVLTRPARDRRILWWAGGAVAAAVALALSIGPMMRAASEEVTDSSEQALHQKETVGTTGTVEHSTPTPPSNRGLAPRPETGIGTDAELEHVGGDGEGIELIEPIEPSRRGSRWERFAALANRAQAHWREGRHARARRLFAVVVAEGGRSRAAEMAYADLFTLAYQAEDRKSQRNWWRKYLRRFPRGRFADDARAGLCRSSATAERADCWSKYLVDFPRGSFRAEGRVAEAQTRERPTP